MEVAGAAAEGAAPEGAAVAGRLEAGHRVGTPLPARQASVAPRAAPHRATGGRPAPRGVLSLSVAEQTSSRAVDPHAGPFGEPTHSRANGFLGPLSLESLAIGARTAAADASQAASEATRRADAVASVADPGTALARATQAASHAAARLATDSAGLATDAAAVTGGRSQPRSA